MAVLPAAFFQNPEVAYLPKTRQINNLEKELPKSRGRFD
jgi:hypothetical protein